MAKKEFDFTNFVEMKLGYYRYAVPKDAALAVFELFAGHDIYRLDTHYKDGKSDPIAVLVDDEQSPGIRTMSPTQLMIAIENQKMKDAENAKKAVK